MYLIQLTRKLQGNSVIRTYLKIDRRYELSFSRWITPHLASSYNTEEDAKAVASEMEAYFIDHYNISITSKKEAYENYEHITRKFERNTKQETTKLATTWEENRPYHGVQS